MLCQVLPAGYRCSVRYFHPATETLYLLQFTFRHSSKALPATHNPGTQQYSATFRHSCDACRHDSKYASICTLSTDYVPLARITAWVPKPPSEHLLIVPLYGRSAIPTPPHYSVRIYRPSFRGIVAKTLVFNHWKLPFWACFCKNWVYKCGDSIILPATYRLSLPAIDRQFIKLAYIRYKLFF